MDVRVKVYGLLSMVRRLICDRSWFFGDRMRRLVVEQMGGFQQCAGIVVVDHRLQRLHQTLTSPMAAVP